MAACALRANTLVALPTGLGKTFVAAVVMLNFYRWFPEVRAPRQVVSQGGKARSCDEHLHRGTSKAKAAAQGAAMCMYVF
jgi:ERCC4-related helicase